MSRKLTLNDYLNEFSAVVEGQKGHKQEWNYADPHFQNYPSNRLKVSSSSRGLYPAGQDGGAVAFSGGSMGGGMNAGMSGGMGGAGMYGHGLYDLKQNLDYFMSESPMRTKEASRQTIKVETSFNNAKDECLNLIRRLRELIRDQKEEMQEFADIHFSKIHQKFLNLFQDVKSKILLIIENSFRDCEKNIREKLQSQGKITPVQFNEVFSKLGNINTDLDRLEKGLQGPTYKQYIAETVKNNFQLTLEGLHETIVKAKSSFSSSDMDIRTDEHRLDCIDRDLKSLFIVNDVMGVGSPMGYSRGESMHENRDKLRAALFSTLKSVI